MLTPPAGLTEENLLDVLAGGWQLDVKQLAHQPLGWGSHHWTATERDGRLWFVTVDELETKRHSRNEPLGTAFARHRGSLAAAVALRAAGRRYVVAPLITSAGEPAPAVRQGSFAIAVYPEVKGDSFDFDDVPGEEHQRAIEDMVIGVHTATGSARGLAHADDFTIPHRDEVDAAVQDQADPAGLGPYSRDAAALLLDNETAITRALNRYDRLVAAAKADASRAVLTHGEPHPGNTMRTADGWRLIDWDTALIAPPERDLWMVDSGDGETFQRYAAATGMRVEPELLELYRLRWALADVAVDVARFRRPHAGTPDDAKSWNLLRANVGELADTARPSRQGADPARQIRKNRFR